MLRRRGFAVPEDVSVVGYDDHKIIAETLFPALTTAELPYSAMGARAAQVLLDIVEERAEVPTAPIRISGQTIRRGSLIAPRREAKNNIVNLKGRNEI